MFRMRGCNFGAVLPILLLFDCQELWEDLEWRQQRVPRNAVIIHAKTRKNAHVFLSPSISQAIFTKQVLTLCFSDVLERLPLSPHAHDDK